MKNPIQTVENHPLEAFEMLIQMQNSQHQVAFDNDGMVPDDDGVSHPSRYTWLTDLDKTIEDLKKAVFYINNKINTLENERNN